MPSYYQDNQLTTLHQVVSSLGRGVSGDIQKDEVVNPLNRLCHLLKEGADPNEEDSYGRTPLAILMEVAATLRVDKRSDSDWDNAKAMVKALIDSGANPLIKDRAIGKSDSLSLGILMAKEVVSACAEGRIMEDEDGGNLLHVLAEEDIGLLLELLRQEVSPNKEINSSVFPTTWLSQSRASTGDTPAHTLLYAFKKIRLNIGDYMNAEGSLPSTWECIECFFDLGVDFCKKNKANISIASLVAEEGRFSISDGGRVELLERIKSIATHEKIQEKTCKSLGKGSFSRF